MAGSEEGARGRGEWRSRRTGRGATRAVRLAAEIGATLRDDVYVSFTTLLLALIYAEDDLSRRFASALAARARGH